MSQLTEQLKQLGGMLDAQQRILRVLKRGHYPASVAGDVERGINYLKTLNAMTSQQMKVLSDAIKREPKTPNIAPESAAAEGKVG